MPPYSPQYGYNSQSNLQNSYYQSSPQRSYHPPPSPNMPTYYVNSTHSLSRSGSRNPPAVYQTYSGNNQYLPSRDYAYSESGRRRRSSSVGHGHYTSAYYPPPARSSRSNEHRRSSRDYGSSSHRRSHSQTRPVYIESSHTTHHSSRRPSVSYSDSGYHRPHSRHSSHSTHETIGDKFRRWFGGHGHSDSKKYEYYDTRTGRAVDKSGRPIYRV
ncbi:hypothetical protein BC835DRAFT_1303952 [Cytidiella melzeri]|nr:hypothetical protein BC835DRAFT_1303952 [Cytidiella melzeri]